MTDEQTTHRLTTEGADLLTLAGVNDANLIELSRQTGTHVALRGDTLTLVGPGGARSSAPASIAQRMIDAAQAAAWCSTPDDVLRMSDATARATPASGARRRRASRCPASARVIQPKTPGQAEYLGQIAGQRHRRRHRARRNGQDVSRRRRGRRRADAKARAPHRARASRGRSGREPRLPARRHAGEGRSVSASAVRRARRHDARRAHAEGARDAHHRDRAARVHARPHARRRVRDPRRGAERHGRADEDVSDASRREFEDGDHRRQDADRLAEARGIRPDAGRAHPHRASTASRSTTSTRRTSCVTGSCATSSRRTPRTAAIEYVGRVVRRRRRRRWKSAQVARFASMARAHSSRLASPLSRISSFPRHRPSIRRCWKSGRSRRTTSSRRSPTRVLKSPDELAKEQNDIARSVEPIFTSRSRGARHVPGARRAVRFRIATHQRQHRRPTRGGCPGSSGNSSACNSRCRKLR